GACVFTDRWRLDELVYGIPSDGPYQTNPPSIEDIISSIRINREGQVHLHLTQPKSTMNSTNASSSNPSKKIKLTIILPRQLFVNISSDEEITTTPSPTTTSSSPTPLNAPSKTPSTNQTSSSQDNTSFSF
ncbi:hypothetical protein Tco_0082671, partial [Tanacetum coccineum]